MPGAPTTLACQGPGVAPPADYDWRAEPPCGHKFAWRSLKERTGGSGKWPVTATTNWTVAWQSNTGVSGADALTATTADQWDVGEYRTVLVQAQGVDVRRTARAAEPLVLSNRSCFRTRV